MKERELLAISLHWRRKYEKTKKDVARPTIEWLLDGICKDARLSLSISERHEVLLEYCQKYKQTI